VGVDLSDVVPKQPRTLQDLQGKTIAIDAYNALYQFLSSIRQPDGTPLKDRRGNVTSHLSGLLYRTANLAEERKERKVKAEAEYQQAVAEGDEAKMLTKAQQTSYLSPEMVADSKRLLDALGLPWVQAPSEGEAQAAFMARNGDVWAASSQDFDALLFGAPRLVRNLAVTGKRKLPGKSIWVDVEPELIELEGVLKELALTREQLVDAGILVGTDFDPGVKGVGPKRAVKLVKEKGALPQALASLDAEIPYAEQIRQIFLEPETTTEYKLAFKTVDEAAVKKLLVEEHDFGEDRVRSTFPRFAKLQEAMKQRSLDAFF